MLVLLDGATGETINAGGRVAVSGDPEGKHFPWREDPKALRTTGGSCIGKPCVVM